DAAEEGMALIHQLAGGIGARRLAGTRRRLVLRLLLPLIGLLLVRLALGRRRGIGLPRRRILLRQGGGCEQSGGEEAGEGGAQGGDFGGHGRLAMSVMGRAPRIGVKLSGRTVTQKRRAASGQDPVPACSPAGAGISDASSSLARGCSG